MHCNARSTLDLDFFYLLFKTLFEAIRLLVLCELLIILLLQLAKKEQAKHRPSPQQLGPHKASCPLLRGCLSRSVKENRRVPAPHGRQLCRHLPDGFPRCEKGRLLLLHTLTSNMSQKGLHEELVGTRRWLWWLWAILEMLKRF